jgi:hypothetical protein
MARRGGSATPPLPSRALTLGPHSCQNSFRISQSGGEFRLHAEGLAHTVSSERFQQDGPLLYDAGGQDGTDNALYDVVGRYFRITVAGRF